MLVSCTITVCFARVGGNLTLSLFLLCSEDKVIQHYKKLKGLSRGQAIIR